MIKGFIISNMSNADVTNTRVNDKGVYSRDNTKQVDIRIVNREINQYCSRSPVSPQIFLEKRFKLYDPLNPGKLRTLVDNESNSVSHDMMTSIPQCGLYLELLNNSC